MKIMFIGTGSGVCALNRFYSSILFSTENEELLIDTGDGITRQLISLNVDILNIDTIIITHLHSDHFAGLPNLIVNMKLRKRTKPLKIILDEDLVTFVKQLLNQLYIFINKLPFELIFVPFKGYDGITTTNSFVLDFYHNKHLQKYLAQVAPLQYFFSSYSVSMQYGSIIQEDRFSKGINIFYSSDIDGLDDLKILSRKFFNYIILETTHINIDEINYITSRYPMEKFLLTHIPDNIEQKLAEWHNNLDDYDKERIIITYDGLVLTI